jgi:5-(carboxyamino)imidazole ribonucleotide synthase
MSACSRCEFFETTDGPVFNEMAPRVHNSAATGRSRARSPRSSRIMSARSAACRSAAPRSPRPRVEMRNLIGAQADDWAAILGDPAAHLHLYGKGKARRVARWGM